MSAWRHFKTITKHKFMVMGNCFRLGLIWQGLAHDMSKYTPTEFCNGAKYYQGTRSPNNAERENKGFSEAWMHHKGRNRHHYEYWTDLNLKTLKYETVPMPRKYLAEMVADRVAACKNYQGKAYHAGSAIAYLGGSIDRELMHPQTRRELEYLLAMLRDKGEKETFRYIRKSVLKGKPFPWEIEKC